MVKEENKIVLIDYDDWQIYHHSMNYTLAKIRNVKQPKVVGYHMSIEHALKTLYNEVLLKRIERDEEYETDLQSLRRHIQQVDAEFDDILKKEFPVVHEDE